MCAVYTDSQRSLSSQPSPEFHIGVRLIAHNAVIRVYDEAGNVIETHEHKGDFKEW
jgi:hypothetical protein